MDWTQSSHLERRAASSISGNDPDRSAENQAQKTEAGKMVRKGEKKRPRLLTRERVRGKWARAGRSA